MLLWIRGDEFKSKDDFESLVSKEASYYFNNVLMLVAPSDAVQGETP